METQAKQLALGRHYLEIGQAQRALETLGSAGAAGVADVEWWAIRAQALFELERHDEALRAAREGLRLDGEEIALLDVAAAAQAELGDLEGAERTILTALRLDAEDPQLLARYALVLMRGAELRKAERVLEQAERLDADDAMVMRSRVALLYLQGKDKQAAKHSERLLEEVDAEDPVGHAMLGAHASNRGNFRRASRHFDTAARADLSDDDFVDLARTGRVEAHPLFWPLWPFQRFGPGKVWAASVGLFVLLAALEQYVVLGVVWVTYMVLVVYSWVVPPLARRWLERRYS